MSHRRKKERKAAETALVFYFDESHKTDFITIKDDGRINIKNQNESDTSVGVFIGIPEEKIQIFERRFIEIEERTKRRIGMRPDEELKSTTFEKKHYKNGLSSFKGSMVEFYTSLIDLLLEMRPVIHISLISKTEILVYGLLESISVPDNVDADLKSLMFGLIKYLDTCAGPDAFRALCSAFSVQGFEAFKTTLVEDHLNYVAEGHDGSHSRGEKEVFNSLMTFLNLCKFSISSEKTFDFPFVIMFDSLKINLYERGLDDRDMRLVIDGDTDQYPESEIFFEKVGYGDSKQEPMIRVCDHLAGFLGRMIQSMFEARYCSDSHAGRVNPSGRTLRLDDGWFELDESRYDLYKKLYLLFHRDHRYRLATMSMLYAESPVMFYALIEFMGTLRNYRIFSRIPPEFLREMYETFSVDKLVYRLNRTL